MSRSRWIVLGAIVLTALPAMANTFVNLGPGRAEDISKDGSLVGGDDAGGAFFFWSQATGKVNVLGMTNHVGIDVYNDGTGNTILAAGMNGSVATVWNGKLDGTGTLTALPSATGFVANKLGVKADNTDYWVAGYNGSGSGRRAARWKKSSNSVATFSGPSGNTDHSADMWDGQSDVGTYVGRHRDANVGGARKPSGNFGSSVWLGRAPAGSSTEGEANWLSSDGKVGVGWDNGYPVWWGPLGGDLSVHIIPFLPGDTYGEAMSSNNDGSIIVGWSQATGTTDRKNWIWDATNGTRELGAFLASMGAPLPAGATLNFAEAARAVVGDYNNLTLAGTMALGGVNTAWVAVVPEPACVFIVLAGLRLVGRGV